MLFNMHAGYVMGIIKRYIKSEYESKDVFLRTFELVFRNLIKYDYNKGSFKTWLKTISINTSLTFIKANKRHHYKEINDEDHFYIEPSILHNYDFELISRLVKELRDPYGIIFNMVMDGYKHKEICKKLNITEATSRSYYQRSRKMIIKKLDQLKIELLDVQ